jgi:hypothetical protein
MATGPDRFEDDGEERDDDELVPVADPAAVAMHDGMPIRGYNRGEPIPDLCRLPRERWREALRPLSPFTRGLAAAGVATSDDAYAALALVGELSVEGPDVPLVPRMPARAAAPAPRGASRQVNFRLGPEEHARLVRAARAYGMRPGAFARVLAVRGVDAALYEERRDR